MGTGSRPPILRAAVLCFILVAVAAPAFAGKTFEVIETVKTHAGYTCRGATIQHADYKLELREGIVRVPLFTLYSRGAYESVRVRAENVAAKLEHGVDLMNLGGVLMIKQSLEGNPSLWVTGPWDGVGDGHHIITVYPEDTILFGRAAVSPEGLAGYIHALVTAHYTLFIRQSLSIEDYDQLAIDEKTSEGKIFKAIVLDLRNLLVARANKIEELGKLPRDTRKAKIMPALQETVRLISMEQRLHLYLLAYLLPPAWSEKAAVPEAK